MLPHGRSGFEVFDEIRTAPELNRVPVVLVTARRFYHATQGCGEGFLGLHIETY